MQWDSSVVFEQKGFSINFHEDFLKGTELAHQIKKYGFFSYSVNEALHLSPKEEKLIESLTSDPVAILLDTAIKGVSDGGGTGVTFDWSIAEKVQNAGLPVIIAGGLTPENIEDAVSSTRPWGIDVAGGTEAGPGKKDHDKVKKFIGGARKAAIESSKGF